MYKDAKHYIASLYILINEQNESIVYVGSNDGTIYVYRTDSCELKSKLNGHELTVCSINGHQQSQKIITGSWDKTAKVWLSDIEICKLDGHQAAVWATCFVSDQIVLTGSADKTVKIWRLDTKKCIRTIDAHTDCVRDLKMINQSQFLSCSNDATIKRWNLDGVLIEQYDGHENYIYSICVIISDENNLKFATTSEDKTLRIWQNGKNRQSIRLPAQTLWSVCRTMSNELVVGCSNGNIYIYTQDERLYAPEAVQNQIKDEISKTNLQMSELGDIKVDQLPNKDCLNLPGKKEGETKLVKDGQSIFAYQWSASKFEWIKVGDVVGTANTKNDPSQKQEYEGQLYDFVFSVDIEDGVPALKLPYNIDQNPWIVAQQFIDKHELSQAYLDEVANFIVKNSQNVNQVQASASADPFTGASSYRPTSSQPTSSQSKTNGQLVNDYYPLKAYFLFESINLDGITKKLKEFSKSAPLELQISSDDLKSLLNLTDLSQQVTENQLQTIKKLLKWPQTNLFPVLDFIRGAVLIPTICEALCNNTFSNSFLDVLLESATNQNSTPNQYLSLRCLCNLFKSTAGEQFIKQYDHTILAKVNLCLQSGNKNVQVALSTLYMNFSVFIVKHASDDLGVKTELALNSMQMLQDQFDPEAQFRSLVTVGTIVEQDKHMIDLIRSEELFKFLQRLSSSNVDKLSKCAQLLHNKIKN